MSSNTPRSKSARTAGAKTMAAFALAAATAIASGPAAALEDAKADVERLRARQIQNQVELKILEAEQKRRIHDAERRQFNAEQRRRALTPPPRLEVPIFKGN